MRPKSNKENMRDFLRRKNKLTHGVKRYNRRRKRKNRKKKRHELHSTKNTISTKDELIYSETIKAKNHTKNRVILPKNHDLKEEKEEMSDYIKFLLWRIEEQENKHNEEMKFLDKVHQCQTRRILSMERKLRSMERKLRSKEIQHNEEIEFLDKVHQYQSRCILSMERKLKCISLISEDLE